MEVYILKYRQDFGALVRAAQDRDLLWIFGNSASAIESQAHTDDVLGNSDGEDTGPTPREDDVEHVSPSSSEAS
eukprot:6603542-Lingulodinium_polyedra.AAC.1